MTTEIEAKLREIDMEPDEEKALENKSKLVQALLRALKGLDRIKPYAGGADHIAYTTTDDIAKILSAPNDKEGE